MKKILSYLGTALLLASTSCADFLDINDSPNSPTSVTPSVLLPSGLIGTAFSNSNELNRFASTIVSVTAGAGGSPSSYDTYNLDGTSFGNQWSSEIYRSLITYDKLIESSAGINAKSYQGIAKIMKAYTFALATDVWGDIPYSEGLKGAEIPQPKLDLQEKIYLGDDKIQSLFDLVREGLNDLSQTSAVNPSADDIIYGGNIANWRRAGNSLLLKLANTISRRNPELARTVINQVIADNNFIVANNQNLNVRFGSSVGSRSPIFEYTRVSLFQNDMMISKRFVDLLQSKNDPRLPIFVTKPAGSYVTIDNGFRGTLPQPVSSWSKFNDYVTGTTGEGPVRLLTNAQTSFILAESALELGTTGDAESYYRNGIRASMSDAGLTAAQIDSYFSTNSDEISLNGTKTQNLNKIMTQKYIALFGNGLEQWNDFRRTGFPELADHQNVVGIDGTRPVRAQYINEEIARNPNFKVVLPNVKVWWDVD